MGKETTLVLVERNGPEARPTYAFVGRVGGNHKSGWVTARTVTAVPAREEGDGPLLA
jgi:stringent starvation protein B